jgi:hypothetical protein
MRMLRRLFLIVPLLAAAASAGAAPPLQKLWTERKFDAVERALREACGGARSADGQPELQAFEAAFDSQFRTMQSWEADRAALAQWRGAQPDSLAQALVEAIYWRAYASQLRVGSVAALPREALDLYHEQIGNGAARLQQVKAQAGSCPLWHSLNISLLLEGGAHRRAVASAYLDAVQVFPQDPQIHYAMGRAYSPRGGGSVVQFDQFARRAVFFTRPTEGGGMYARLYWREDGNGSEAITFADRRSLPEWQLVKTGFEDLLQRYPSDAAARNKFASFACRANDRDTYGRLRVQLGERIIAEQWPDSWPVEACDRKLLKHG